MSQSQYFGTFIFLDEKRVPLGAEIVTRRVPPKPPALKADDDVPCDDIMVHAARDENFEAVLVLHTPLLRSEAAWDRFIASGIGAELWAACSNGVVYRIEPAPTAERMSRKGAKKKSVKKTAMKPVKKAAKTTARKMGKTAAKAPAKTSAKTTAKTPAKKVARVAKKVGKNKGTKKSKKPRLTLSRGGVPPKSND